MKTTVTTKKKIFLHITLFVLAGLATLQGKAEAVVSMPDFERLTPITASIVDPSDVALDQLGRVYVAETTKNRVTVLSQSGQYTGKRISISSPLCVAVDGDGNILIGSAKYGSVSVYGPDLAYRFKLGGGDMEFGKPMDIAIDNAGKIYVVDKTNNAIKTYNSLGSPTGAIGTPGNDAGQLYHPTSIAIDENTGELVVLDHQQILDRNTNKMIDGARIQYFYFNGSPVPGKSFSKFGYNNAGMDWSTGTTIYDITMGQMTRPNQLAVDQMSRVYVTDARLQKVMVYDNNDTFLGTVDSTDHPMRIPIGIAMGASSRLYVASLFTNKVEVFGVDEYTALVAAPSTVEFSVVENDTAPPAKRATVTNQGKSSIILTTTASEQWVSVTTSASSLLSTETANVDIAVDPDGFAPGKYSANVTVDTGAGAAEVIKVTLNVKSNPLLVAPGTIHFDATEGTTPDGQDLTVTSGENGQLLWNASSDQQWIALNTSSGVTPDTVRVYADISTLTTGDHNGTITFVQQGNDASTIEIAVTLTLSESDQPAEDLPGIGNNGKTKWNKKWTTTQVLPGTGTALNGVGGTSATDIYAVGENGTIVYFNGNDWTQVESGTTNELNSVWSSSPTNSYAVGAAGLVLNYNGTDWGQVASAGDAILQDIWGNADTSLYTAEEFGTVLDGTFGSTAELGVALRSIWGNADDDVYVAGEAGAIFHYDGSAWTPMTSNTTEWLNGVWASSPTNIYAVGENGTVVKFDGNEWSAMDAGTTSSLNGICAFSDNDIFVVGDNSVILHYDGNNWSAMDAGTEVNLNDVWCSGKSDIIAVGDDGTIIQGRANKFPWVRILHQIALNGAERVKREKEEKQK